MNCCTEIKTATETAGCCIPTCGAACCSPRRRDEPAPASASGAGAQMCPCGDDCPCGPGCDC